MKAIKEGNMKSIEAGYGHESAEKFVLEIKEHIKRYRTRPHHLFPTAAVEPF